MPIRRGPAALAGASLALLALAACVPRTAPPAPVPAPAPRPVALPPEEAPPPYDWTQVALSAGGWRFSVEASRPRATFSAPEGLRLILSCERSGFVSIGFRGMQAEHPPGLSIRTTFGERLLATTSSRTGEMSATLPAGDQLLDQMAFSRGRIEIGADGGPHLVVPAWPEIARVIEDCRGQ
jgi:hypothetical protein